jgi:hypothetical protein
MSCSLAHKKEIGGGSVLNVNEQNLTDTEHLSVIWKIPALPVLIKISVLFLSFLGQLRDLKYAKPSIIFKLHLSSSEFLSVLNSIQFFYVSWQFVNSITDEP